MARLGLQEAVKRATDILLHELYPNKELRHVLLEEIELDRNGTWYVTLGFTRPDSLGGIAGLVPPPEQRAYKVIKINSETGDFEGMTDRRFEQPARAS